MTEREFDTWWKAHRAAFLSIDQWLGKMPTDTERRAGFSNRLSRSEIPQDEITSGDVLRTWKATLSDVPLQDALDVTAAMARGDIDRPQGWDEHARHVRRHARKDSAAVSNSKPKGRLVGGVWTYECGKCQDQGLLDIWSKLSVDLAASDPEGFLASRRGRFRHVVACTCDEGDRQVRLAEKQKRVLPVYDDRRMHLWQDFQSGAEALVAAISASYANAGNEWNPDSNGGW